MVFTKLATEESRVNTQITTPGGYTYDEPDLTGHPDVSINMTYVEAYDTILDGIMSNASIEPITEATFKALAVDLLGLLIDSAE